MSSARDPVPEFLADLLGWFSITVLGVGARTGLLEALRQGPASPEQLAERAGVDRRNAFEWLRALAAARHVVVNGTTFALTDETLALLGCDSPVNAWATLEFVHGVPAMFPALEQAIRTGRGVRPACYEPLGAALAAMNTSTYVTALVHEWIAAVPGLTETLARGGVVADLGCGDGSAAVIVGTAFPSTRVIGFDVNAALLDRNDLPANVVLCRADARALPAGDPFDLVLVLDSLHHFGDVDLVVSQVHERLTPGGVLLIAEGGLSGHFATDAENPFSLISYATSLLYCLQENLAQGGRGRTDTDGWQWISDALSAAGFDTVKDIASETGFHIIVGVA